jgi:hypothetical protein
MSDGLDSFGCEDIGVDYGSILQSGGALAQGIVAAKEASDAESKTSADEQKKLSLSIAADVAAVAASARADTTAPRVGRASSPTAAVDAQAADLAMKAADHMAEGLSEASQQKRADAADKQLADAIKRAQANPKDEYLAAMVKEWTAQANKAHNGSITASDDGKKGKKGKGASGESFWTRRVIGPIPGYGVVAGGVGLAGGLGFAIKKIFFR